MALPYLMMVREASVTLALYSSLPLVARSTAHVVLPYCFDCARGVGDARALLLAALGGEVDGARGAAVLDDCAREASVTLALYSSLL